MAERHRKCRALVKKYYADVPGREVHLDRAVAPFLRAGATLLDAGCGSHAFLLRRYGGGVSLAVGVDVVPSASSRVDAGAPVLGDLGMLPFRDSSFDVIVSRSVVEHLGNPVPVFAELHRVARPGGVLIFTTPNRYYYSSLVARAIPQSWKDAYMRRVFGAAEEDHFVAYYRANTRRALARIASSTGFRIESVQALRHYPYYFFFSPALFRFGMLYDRIVTRLGLDALQSTWLVVMERV